MRDVLWAIKYTALLTAAMGATVTFEVYKIEDENKTLTEKIEMHNKQLEEFRKCRFERNELEELCYMNLKEIE